MINSGVIAQKILRIASKLIITPREITFLTKMTFSPPEPA
ncbi:hypothetical protein MYAER_0609 [Microcystis aeruginosa NIES-2549]|uniref:Uncharacterized protein n=1 Tax=Microcystis aeruginosa NIES-2549 TaxID=1641812 RepID=A0A0F6U277_MICAE|nr:hypothetical protein MYAER_0609 [Microcystis aeruginosa NIES-2549]AOC51362.1 hypothetical protein amyaer_0613 [Microcystis aeruginosa NIES-2481]